MPIATRSGKIKLSSEKKTEELASKILKKLFLFSKIKSFISDIDLKFIIFIFL